MSTATPTAPPPAGPAPARVSREYAEEFIAGVDRWIWQLAHQHHERGGMTAEDLAHEIRADVFLNLHKYDAARGSRTNWVALRCRYVVSLVTRKMGRLSSAAAFSQLPGAATGRDLAEVLVVDDQEPDADLLAADDDAEREQLRAGVRTALGFLPPGHEADVRAYYGIGADPDQETPTLCQVAAARGVSKTRVGQTIAAGLATLREDGRLQELASRHEFG